MTLAELIAWHQRQENSLIGQSHDTWKRAQDKRASGYTRQLYRNDQQTCLDLARHHRAALNLLEQYK